MCTLTCNRKTLQLISKALTIDSKRSKWPLQVQPALRSWRPGMGNGKHWNNAMKLVWKAKLWAALPEIHAETANFSPRWLHYGQEADFVKVGTGMSLQSLNLCYEAWISVTPEQSDSRFKPFHPPESRTSAMSRHEGSFRISFYTQFLFVSCFSMPADWDQGMKVRDSQNRSQENTLRDTNGISEGIRD